MTTILSIKVNLFNDSTFADWNGQVPNSVTSTHIVPNKQGGQDYLGMEVANFQGKQY